MRDPTDLFSWRPLKGWRAKEPTKAARLRELYEKAAKEDRWLSQQELIDALAHRFGATIHYIHDAKDGLNPAHYERWEDPEDDSRVMYRPRATAAECTNCIERAAKEAKEKSLLARIAELEAENASLRARLGAR